MIDTIVRAALAGAQWNTFATVVLRTVASCAVVVGGVAGAQKLQTFGESAPPATSSVARSAQAYGRHAVDGRHEGEWSADELKVLQSLSLSSLEPLPPDPSNRVADDARAAQLGKSLFFDTRLSGNGKVACATCHIREKDFQDGTALAKGMGTTTRRTMPIVGGAHSPWQFWDGRADSQWAQALGPLESGVEHGGDRTLYAHVMESYYRDAYTRLFGPLPRLDDLPRRAGPVSDSAARAAWQRLTPARQGDVSRVYANIGKAIAAFERTLQLTPTRFDRYVDAELTGRGHSPDATLSSNEVAGLRIFIGKGSCINCHNGARFTDDHFHNTGVQLAAGLPVDSGRSVGVRQALAGEFNCLSRYSDAKPDDCAELQFAVTEGHELVRAFKTPSLRGVAERAPYMHAGQIASLGDVISHYNRAPSAPMGHSELKRIGMTSQERMQLEQFLRTLSAPSHERD